MANRIQVRRGTSTQWSNADPILSEGEIGYNSTLGSFKIGDGTTVWSELDYYQTTENITPAEVGAIALTEKNAANGVAELDADKNVITASKIVFEGATANEYELFIQVGAEPSADVTLTLPTTSGTFALSGDLSGYAALSGATFTGAVSGTDLTLSGNLTVNGTTTTIDTQNLLVEDKNIIIGNVTSPTDAGADGGGITLKGTTDKTFNWIDATDSWTSSENINVVSGKEYKVNGTSLKDVSETLTNKSISGSSNTITNVSLTAGVTGTLPVANGGTGITSFGTGIATFLGTPSSANLASAVTDETGSGALVFATSPTLTTPNLGTPSAATLTNATGLPISTGVSGLGANIATFLATPSSANLASAVTDETGSGALVFGTSPTIATPTLTLSSTTSTTSGRIAFDATTDKIIIGDGTSAIEFAPSTILTNAQIGTSYTLVLADKDKLVELSNASAITLNIPTNSVAYPVGTQINILQTGAGQVTIAAGTPATTTVNGTPGLKLRAQWSSATLIKRATETWVAIGDLSA